MFNKHSPLSELFDHLLWILILAYVGVIAILAAVTLGIIFLIRWLVG